MHGEVSGLFSRLKLETAIQHETLERDLALLDQTVSLERYGALLMRFYGFYQPWETNFHPPIERWLPGSTEGRSKVPLLAADLEYLRCDPATAPLASVTPPTCLAAALGSMYVLEGSTLGGQLISRHLATALNLPTLTGRRFFSSYGENVGPMWRRFKDLLQAYSSPTHDEQMICSANETFSSLHAWLCSTPC